jgi:hypothetical protein
MESQMDDATNIHGNFATVDRILDRQTFEIRLMHSQHAGFPLLCAGDSAGFFDRLTLVPIGEARVAEVSCSNRDLFRVRLEINLPDRVAPGGLVANAGQCSPDVEITGCSFVGNRARGILLGSSGRILVERNLFHNPGAAILLEGDGKTWFEQAGVRNLTIRENRFENCNFGVWGRAAIEISSPHIDGYGIGERCHRNISITGNTFVSFDDTPLLQAHGADGVTFQGNRLERSACYPPIRVGFPPIITQHSERLIIELSDCSKSIGG